MADLARLNTNLIAADRCSQGLPELTFPNSPLPKTGLKLQYNSAYHFERSRRLLGLQAPSHLRRIIFLAPSSKHMRIQQLQQGACYGAQHVASARNSRFCTHVSFHVRPCGSHSLLSYQTAPRREIPIQCILSRFGLSQGYGKRRTSLLLSEQCGCVVLWHLTSPGSTSGRHCTMEPSCTM